MHFRSVAILANLCFCFCFALQLIHQYDFLCSSVTVRVINWLRPISCNSRRQPIRADRLRLLFSVHLLTHTMFALFVSHYWIFSFLFSFCFIFRSHPLTHSLSITWFAHPPFHFCRSNVLSSARIRSAKQVIFGSFIVSFFFMNLASRSSALMDAEVDTRRLFKFLLADDRFVSFSTNPISRQITVFLETEQSISRQKSEAKFWKIF